MSIGFIGCGNMASAIIKGIVASGAFDKISIYAFDLNTNATINAKNNYDIGVADSAKDIASNCDIIVLAVKPNVIMNVLDEIKSVVNKDKLVVSIAAGKTINYIESGLDDGIRIIRVMPNINAMIGEAISAYTANKYATNDDKESVERILNSIGECIYLDEKQFALFGVLGGCSPAFAYMYIDELARAGVQNGMTKDIALKIAAQSVLGSAKMILESDEHPYELIDKVCSPGGTTIEGVVSLKADGFDKAINNAVNKSLEKDAKL